MSQLNLRDNVPGHILDVVEYVSTRFVTDDERIAYLQEAGVPLGQIEGVLDFLRGGHTASGSGNIPVETRLHASVPPQTHLSQPCGSASSITIDMPFQVAQSYSSLGHRPFHMAGPSNPTTAKQMTFAAQLPADLLSAPCMGSVHKVGQQQWVPSAPLGTIDPRLLGGPVPAAVLGPNVLGISGTQQSMGSHQGPIQPGTTFPKMTHPGGAGEPLPAALVHPQAHDQPQLSVQPPTPVRPAVIPGPGIARLALPPRPPPSEPSAQINRLALPPRPTSFEASAGTNRLALPPHPTSSEAVALNNRLALPPRPTSVSTQSNRHALPPLSGKPVSRPSPSVAASLSAPPSISLALPPVSVSSSPAILAQSPARTTPSTPNSGYSSSLGVDVGVSKAAAESDVNKTANKRNAEIKAPKEPLPFNLQAIVDASEPAKRKKIEEAFWACAKGLVLLHGSNACTQCKDNGYPCHARSTRATKEQMADGKLRFFNCNMCVVLKVGQRTCSLHSDYVKRQDAKAAPPVFGGRSTSLPPTEPASAGSKRKTRDWMKHSQQQVAVMNASNFGTKRTKLSDGGRSRSATPGQSDFSLPWSRSRSQTPGPLSAASLSGCFSETSTPPLTATGSRASPLTAVEEDDEDEDLEEVLIPPVGVADGVDAPSKTKDQDLSSVSTHAACPQNIGPTVTGPADDSGDDDERGMEEVPIAAGSASQTIERGESKNHNYQDVIARTPQKRPDATPKDEFAQLLEEALQVDDVIAQPQAQSEPQTRPSAEVSTPDATPRGQKRVGVETEDHNAEEGSHPPKKRRKKAKKTQSRPTRAPTPRELAKRVVEAGPLLDDLDQQIDYAYEVYRRIPFVVRQIKSRKNIYYAPHIKCVRCAENGKLCAYAVISLAQINLDCDWVVLPGCEACEGAGLLCHFQYDAGVMFGTLGSIRAKVDPSEGQPRGPRPGGTASGMFDIVPYLDPTS